MEEQLVRPGSPLDGKTVGTSGLRSRLGLILVAIKRRDGHLAFNPETTRPSPPATRSSPSAVASSRSVQMRSPSTEGSRRRGGAPAAADEGARWSRIGTAVFGALLGGLVGGFLVVGVTLVLKAGMDFVAVQSTWYSSSSRCSGWRSPRWFCTGSARARAGGGRTAHPWRTFPPEAARADISADVVNSAGEEERFPWRLAPIRALAILATVGSGAAMGTEAPAAYLGVAAGVCLGDRGRWWRRLLRPAALAGGAAGVAALMAIPLVGTAFMLELGRRRQAPLSAERVIAALVGGVIGWGINVAFHLNLIRLVVPNEPPVSFMQAVVTALFIGALSGIVSSLAGLAVYQAKKWQAPPALRLAIGGAATVATVLVLARIASPSASIGPGRRRHPVGRERRRAPVDAAGRLHSARGGDDRGGRGGRLWRRLRPVPRRRRHRGPRVRARARHRQRSRGRGGRGGRHRGRLPAAAHRGRDGVRRRRPTAGDADLPRHGRGRVLPRAWAWNPCSRS